MILCNIKVRHTLSTGDSNEVLVNIQIFKKNIKIQIGRIRMLFANNSYSNTTFFIFVNNVKAYFGWI